MLKLKKWIIFLTIILILIITIACIILNKNKVQMFNLTDEEPIENNYVFNSILKKVSVRNDYYSVESGINKFYTYCSSMENENKSSIVASLYNMLDEEYISYKNITIDNLTTKLPKIEKWSVSIENMYESEKDIKMSTFFADGHFINTSTGELKPFLIMLKVDMSNRTFSVLLEDYINEKYGDIEEGHDVKIDYPESIKPNGSNSYIFEIIDDKTYITDVLKSFRNNMVYNKPKAYESLDVNYRNKRFPTFEKFEQYIKDNIGGILVIKLSKYEKINDNGDVRYICSDTNGNYYIIDEISTRNCTFILDTYTIDLPEFIEKYKSSDSETKVALNIEKIKEAINEKDFEYVYNKTDDTFKTTKFGSFDDFKNYLQSNLFEKNTFEYKDVDKKSKVYITKVIVTNKNDKKASSKEMEIIMSLDKDSTDYKISFNFGE